MSNGGAGVWPEVKREFILFPAVDVLDGECVRLRRGDYETKTVFAQRPRDAAVRWLTAGAHYLHVVDLNGARDGVSLNQAAIADVVQVAAEKGASVQVGGGIRQLDTVARWLDMGVSRCVIGTAALIPGWLEQALRRFGSEALVVGLDGRDEKLAVRGWLEQTQVAITDLAKQWSQLGVRHALVTDVGRDGMLAGANLDLACQVQDQGLQAIASGGIRHLNDVLAAQRAGLAGAVAGRALYDGSLDLTQALAALQHSLDKEDGNRVDETNYPLF
ncbi:1-(5-phosphoribosyl)-5-((5-phosphoribosylamino)methylideneamino)imidazole-4-carboxamide isomerase [Alicyclobacillaceae bacterium I2511]|nr:1-(5-phosphoribosyl)-5-((5-phosphoribosylamino)methylideneamino)imidazole-4-carboxamide isomerase [Alicyclobacillaceae bacterium I2511]